MLIFGTIDSILKSPAKITQDLKTDQTCYIKFISCISVSLYYIFVDWALSKREDCQKPLIFGLIDPVLGPTDLLKR